MADTVQTIKQLVAAKADTAAALAKEKFAPMMATLPFEPTSLIVAGCHV